tara:strand:- start:527 stop:751 length:225 start_codon:yes stop_codon:yes gene_type:complete
MVATPLIIAHTSGVIPSSTKALPRAIDKLQGAFSFSFVFALVCLTVITVFVPERPQQLASSCEKHNSAIACQIW